MRGGVNPFGQPDRKKEAVLVFDHFPKEGCDWLLGSFLLGYEIGDPSKKTPFSILRPIYKYINWLRYTISILSFMYCHYVVIMLSLYCHYMVIYRHYIVIIL